MQETNTSTYSVDIHLHSEFQPLLDILLILVYIYPTWSKVIPLAGPWLRIWLLKYSFCFSSIIDPSLVLFVYLICSNKI